MKWHLNGLWKPWHDEPLATFNDVGDCLTAIKEAHGKTSAARARGSLRALYVWAISEKKYCKTNPVVGTVDPLKGKKPRRRVLTVAELVTMLQHLPNNAFGRIVWLLLLLGCRRSEVADLQWREINLDTGIMTIPATRTKNHTELILTLPPQALKILQDTPRREEQPFVFGLKPGRGFSAWSGAKSCSITGLLRGLGNC